MCTVCGDSLVETRRGQNTIVAKLAVGDDGLPYCPHHAPLKAPHHNCARCTKSITHNPLVQSSGLAWHVDCFFCPLCREEGTSGVLLSLSGKTQEARLHGKEVLCLKHWAKQHAPRCEVCSKMLVRQHHKMELDGR